MRAPLLAALIALAAPAAAAEPLLFDGVVEASARAELATRVNGIVAEVLFEGGERVEAGQPLILLDPRDAELALAAAEAGVAGARAALDGAAREFGRQETLAERGVAADARLGRARTDHAAAAAALAVAEATRDRAAEDLARTVIRAPIAGFVSRPSVAPGAFLEAEAGPPLAEIVRLDPVLVAYRAPYETRLATLARIGATDAEALFAALRLEVRLPDGQAHGEPVLPRFTAAGLDPETQTITIWAETPNPDLTLRPGLRVRVVSTVVTPGEAPR